MPLLLTGKLSFLFLAIGIPLLIQILALSTSEQSVEIAVSWEIVVKLPPFFSEKKTETAGGKGTCLELGAGSSPCAFCLAQGYECKFSMPENCLISRFSFLW